MSITKDELFREAVNLSPMDKAKLVEVVLSSFSFKNREKIDSAWAEESEDRLDAIMSGEMKTYSEEEVFSSLDI